MNNLNRKLSVSETMYMSPESGDDMIMIFVARIEGLIKPHTLRKALNLAQKRDPMLQIRIVESEDGFCFQSEDTPEIPLHVLNKTSEEQWIKTAENEVEKQFPVNVDPLCRVTFISSGQSDKTSEIVVAMHHIICDGISGLNFVDNLLSYCEKVADEEQISEIETLEALPPLEELFSLTPASNNDLKETHNGFDPEVPPPLITEFFESQASMSSLSTHFLTRSLSQEMTQKLAKRSKEEGTTLHGALCAAMLFSAAKLAPTDIPIPLSCASSVNLRKYCQPEVSENVLACIGDAVTHNYMLEENTSFWDLARESKSRIVSSMNSGDFLVNKADDFFMGGGDSPQDENFAQQMKIQIMEQMERQMRRYSSVYIGNAGRMKFSGEYKNFQIKELYFSAGFHVAGPCFGLNVATLNEQMFCMFPYVTPLTSAKTQDLFVDSVMTTLRIACTSQSLEFNQLSKTKKADDFSGSKLNNPTTINA